MGSWAGFNIMRNRRSRELSYQLVSGPASTQASVLPRAAQSTGDNLADDLLGASASPCAPFTITERPYWPWLNQAAPGPDSSKPRPKPERHRNEIQNYK